MNSSENYHILRITSQNLQLHDMQTDIQNAVFNALLLYFK